MGKGLGHGVRDGRRGDVPHIHVFRNLFFVFENMPIILWIPRPDVFHKIRIPSWIPCPGVSGKRRFLPGSD